MRSSFVQAVASTSRAWTRRLHQSTAVCTCWCVARQDSSAASAPASATLQPRRRYYDDLRGASVRHASTARGRGGGPAVNLLRDEGIRSRWIRLVQSSDEGGGLGPLTAKDSILRNLDKTRLCLQQVDERPLEEDQLRQLPGRMRSPGATFAICKLVDKKERYEQDKAKLAEAKARRKTTKMEEKEVQLTWAVSVNDLTHKLKRAQATIDKGGRIALVVVSPKGTRAPPPPERQAFIEMCREYLGAAEGKVTTWKQPDIQGGMTTVYLQGVKQT